MEPRPDAWIFVRVVEEGSFTRAADVLGLSKGAVSKYVTRLERRLGVRLLNRTTRRLTLTEVGEVFYGRASQALAALREIETEVSEHAAKPRGNLRVSAPTLYGAEILWPHLSTFRHENPDISLELLLENRRVDLVQARVDVAVRMSAPKDSSLVIRRIADIPVVTCASPAYVERHGRPCTPADLREHDCVIYTLGSRIHDWLFYDEGGRPYAVPVRGPFHTNDDQVIRQAGLDGFGILRLPKLFVRQAIDQGRLIQLWPDEAGPRVPLAAMYPSRRELPAKVRVFIDFIATIADSRAPFDDRVSR
jgi:DNA-binding transcriptional LysR family regulator